MTEERKPGQGTTSEEYLRSVTLGPREPINSTIHLAPYNPSWPIAFERHAQRIRAALGVKVLLLEHVGSTSVPGLSAKPVVDIVLAVADSADEASYVPPLEGQGYVLRLREPAWFEHRLLKSPENNVKIHVFADGCEEIDRMLAFRDWLRAHEQDRRLYEETKHRLAQRSWKYTQHYADAKSAVVGEILERALGKRGE